MKTLLIFLAIVLIAAGWAVGLINVFSPGTVTVGLNLDVAATLFTGGCVLLGLAVVAGNLSAMSRREPDEAVAEDYAPAAPAAPAAPVAPAGSDLPDFMAPASAAAAGAATGVAAGAAALGDTANDKADTATEIVDDVLDGIEDSAESTADSAGSIFSSVTGTAAAAAEDATEKAKEVADAAAHKVEEVAEDTVDKARDDLSSFFAQPADTSEAPDTTEAPASTARPELKPSPAAAEEADAETETKPALPDIQTDADVDSIIFADAPPAGADSDDADATKLDTTRTGTITMDPPEAETKKEEAAPTATDEQQETTAEEPAKQEAENAPDALPQEDELFVVEERVIRERPARLLSDGTVEAETDEGWMRFENVEHVEEYLDAMKATA